jgi:regulator of sigma E protease
VGDLGHSLYGFIFVLGMVIFWHEFGHLIAAKAFGMRVFVFSFGFGKRLFGFQWGDTDCRVSLIPLGGYVKLEGEPDDRLSEDTSARGDGRDFLSRPRWQRFLVYLAGPFMNGVLTIAVITVFYMLGYAVDASRYDRPILGVVEPGQPAAAAGLRTGDEILALDGQAVSNWEEAFTHVLLRADRTIQVRFRRDGAESEVAVKAAATSENAGTLGVHTLVRIGELIPDRPAIKAGLRPDDAILRIDGTEIRSFNDIPPLIQKSEGRALRFDIWRDGTLLDLAVTPTKDGGDWMVGLRPKLVQKKFGPAGAVVEAGRWTWAQVRQTVSIIRQLLTLQISTKNLSGPLGIAQMAGQAAREAGWSGLFTMVALISLQVGILNLFPLAPLDGGHLAILAAEGVLRRDFSIDVKNWIMNAGAVVVLLLVGLVLFQDVARTPVIKNLLH